MYFFNLIFFSFLNVPYSEGCFFVPNHFLLYILPRDFSDTAILYLVSVIQTHVIPERLHLMVLASAASHSHCLFLMYLIIFACESMPL